jgi:hypothetical protein
VNWCTYDTSTDRRLNACRLYLTTARPFAYFGLHPTIELHNSWKEKGSARHSRNVRRTRRIGPLHIHSPRFHVRKSRLQEPRMIWLPNQSGLRKGSSGMKRIQALVPNFCMLLLFFCWNSATQERSQPRSPLNLSNQQGQKK